MVFTTHYHFSFTDLNGRLNNLANLKQTGNIYVPFAFQSFTYPPGAILFFWPITWVPAEHLTLIWTVASLAALAGSFAGVLYYLFHRASWWTAGLSCWLAVGAAAITPPIYECLTWGQLGTLLLVMVVLDILVIQGPSKGVLVGLATTIKIYPGLFIVVWLLRRQWRPAITALATTAATTGLAWLLWPASAWTFFTKILLGGQDFDKLTGLNTAPISSSIDTLFMRPPFHPGFLNSPEEIGLMALVVVVVALFGAQRLWRRGFDLSALVLILIASVIAAPATWDHYFAFAPLFFLMPLELGLRSPLARTGIAAGVTMLVPWFIFRLPHQQTTWTAVYAFTARNALLFSALAVLVASFAERSPDRTTSRSDDVDLGRRPHAPH